jgi:broad specificity phosphatase PhoE
MGCDPRGVPTILLLRHAQASFGTADYDVLSETGHRQAEVAHAALTGRGVRPHRLVSGGLRRQLDTIAPWGEVQVDPRLDEYDAADILSAHSDSDLRLESGEGRTPPDSRAFQAVLDDAMQAWITAGADGGADEPYPAFRDRVTAALEELAAALGSGETAVACTSGGVIAAACVVLLGLPDTALPAFNRVMVNASVTKVVHGRRGSSLVAFNEHGHLEAAGRGLVTYR